MKLDIPKVSVVIPVKNDVVNIRPCLEAIIHQSISPAEIIVIDSGSTDGTLDVVKEYSQVKLVEIPSAEFDHGLTRNMGLDIANGDFVALTVQDARPVNDQWIAALLAGFIDDSVAGVCGQQVVPHDPDKNPAQWFRPVSKPQMRKIGFTTAEFEKLTPEQLNAACSWDDVTAMYRRDLKLRFPFVQTSFGEDGIWARQVLEAGYSIVYNPEARVYHYHFEHPDFTFKRMIATMYFKYRYFNYLVNPVKPGLVWFLRMIRLINKTPGLSLQKKWFWLKHNLEIKKTILKARQSFGEALAQGEQELDKLYRTYCGVPPVPLKKVLSDA